MIWGYSYFWKHPYGINMTWRAQNKTAWFQPSSKLQVAVKDNLMERGSVKGSQFQEPLIEFSVLVAKEKPNRYEKSVGIFPLPWHFSVQNIASENRPKRPKIQEIRPTGPTGLTDPEKNLSIDHSSIATYGSRGPLGFGPIQSHRIHVWYIYLHLP